MPAPQYINGKPIVKYEEVYKQSGTILGNAGNNALTQSTITTQRGLRAFVIRLSQAWSAGMDPKVTWRLLVNKVRRFPYEDSTVQISAPESDAWIVPLEVPEATDVEMNFDVNGATPANDGTITTRLGIAYIEKD